MRVYMDIDGVLTDFVGAVGNLYNIDDLVKEWDKRVEDKGLKAPRYDIAAVLGVTDEELWRRVGLFGETFWRTLPLLPWAEELYHEVCMIADETILVTSPSFEPSCAKGKLEWIERQTWIKDKRAYVITPAESKRLLANPASVLIDDSSVNCDNFTRHGGWSITFPQPWNAAHSIVGSDVVAYVVGRLVTIKGKEMRDG